MSKGKGSPWRQTRDIQNVGFNIGIPTSAEWSRPLNDTGPTTSFYFANGSDGVIDPGTGLPASGETKITIQSRAGVKYPLGTYSINWTGDATINGQPPPRVFTLTESSAAINYTMRGQVLSFSITPDSAPSLTYSPTFTTRAANGECFRFMEAWRINEDGGAGAAVYDPANPYVRIRAISGGNTFYHRLMTPTLIGNMGKDFGRDVWICVHHRATDQNIRDFINEIVATGFDGTIYFEHSNEMWNPSFPQWDYAIEQADLSGNYPGVGDTAKVAAWSADRAHQTSGIAKEEYDKLVGVWGGWTAGPNTYNNIHQYGIYSPFANIDAAALSWYFGGVPSRALPLQDALDMDAQGAADMCRDDWETRVIPFLQTWITNVVGDWGKRLIGYEGGSHLDRNSSDAAEAHLATLSQSPEVGVVHGEAYDWWDANVNDLAMFFQDVGNPSKAWSWLHGELGSTSARLQEFYDRARR